MENRLNFCRAGLPFTKKYSHAQTDINDNLSLIGIIAVSISDQRAYLEPNNHGSQVTDGWFKTATIAVPICGFIVLLMLASLAVRLLQPVPDPDRPNGKLMPHRTSVNGPPLLGTPKVPLV